MALNVTSSSFQVSWSVDPPRSRDFHVQVFRGEQLLQSAWTSGLALQVSGLDAGELYVVRTSYQGCSANISTMLTVKTGKFHRKRSPLRLCFCPRSPDPVHHSCD